MSLQRVLNDAERLLKMHQQRQQQQRNKRSAQFARPRITFQTSQVFSRLASECTISVEESCSDRMCRLEKLLALVRSPLLEPLFMHYAKSLKQMCTTFLWQFLSHSPAKAKNDFLMSISKSGLKDHLSASSASYSDQQNLHNYLAACWSNSSLVLSPMGTFAGTLAEYYVQVASVYVSSAASSESEQRIAENDSCFCCCVGDVRRVLDNDSGLITTLSAHLLTLYHNRHASMHEWLAVGGLLSTATRSSHRHLHEHVARFLIRIWLWMLLSDKILVEQWRKAIAILISMPSTRDEAILLVKLSAAPVLSWSRHVIEDCCTSLVHEDDAHILMCRQFIAPLASAALTLCGWFDEYRCAFASAGDPVSAQRIADVQIRLRRSVLSGGLLVARMATEGVGLQSLHASMDRMYEPFVSSDDNDEQEMISFSPQRACSTLSNSFLVIATPFLPNNVAALGADTYGVHLQRASAKFHVGLPIDGAEYDDWAHLSSFCLRIAKAIPTVTTSPIFPSAIPANSTVKKTKPTNNSLRSQSEIEAMQREYVYNVGKNIAKSLVLHTATKLEAAGRIIIIPSS
jgi:hypothetical protein